MRGERKPSFNLNFDATVLAATAGTTLGGGVYESFIRQQQSADARGMFVMTAILAGMCYGKARAAQKTPK